MAQAQKDENRIAVGLGWDELNATAVPLKVDPVTGRLLVMFVHSGGGGGVVNTQPGRRDENRMSVSLGTRSPGGATAIPLHIDSTNGFLFVNNL